MGWRGRRRNRSSLDAGTLQLVYSATKGATATAAHMLVERGALDLDAPVAKYWPGFAANGKADIPVRWLLSHQAGLVALDQPVPLKQALAWHPMVAALAAQRPLWTPGTAHGYHGRTWGWLVGEVIRRASGRSPGRFFADEIAAPLGLDFFIGLPAGERDRVSPFARQGATATENPNSANGMIEKAPDLGRCPVRRLAFASPQPLWRAAG